MRSSSEEETGRSSSRRAVITYPVPVTLVALLLGGLEGVLVEGEQLLDQVLELLEGHIVAAVRDVHDDALRQQDSKTARGKENRIMLYCTAK